MKRLDNLFKNSRRINIDSNSKIVIMSDCHRGAGNNYDNFLKNEMIFEAALNYYYESDYSYIELGDGDELWEVTNYDDIVENYLDIFKKIKNFYRKGRFMMIYGNHDIAKRSKKVLAEHFYRYYDNENKGYMFLLEGLNVYESLVLNYYGHDIFLLHGHQVDFLNGTLWRLSQFLVQHVWKVFEKIGMRDPTSAAKNYQVTKRGEKKLKKWSILNNKIIIAGHTHRPIFPKVGQSLYFNDGSCIHPNGVTCIEIENGNISLVKWEFKVRKDNSICVRRRVIAGEELIINFYLK